MLLSIVIFALIVFGLGWGTLALATGRVRTTVEELAIAPGIGLAVFAVLAILFNPIGIPLCGWPFLIAGAALSAAGVVRARVKGARENGGKGDSPLNNKAGAVPFSPIFSRDDLFLAAAVLLGAVTFLVFLHGAFVDEWLPDDDPWEHAATAKYVALHGTYSIPAALRREFTTYLEPYPPAYPVLMGVLHGAGAPMSWTLKFFNVLLVACAIPWFYLFAKELTKRPAAALWMTGVLWALPCFMSRFIWAQTLAVVLFFPAFYAMERARREPSWAVVFALAAAGVFLAQPSSAAIFGIMAGLFWLVNLGVALAGPERPRPMRGPVRQALALAAALLIAAAFYVPAYVKFGHDEFLLGLGKIPAGKLSLRLAGTAHEKTYGLRDFLWANGLQNQMNQPTGIGFMLSFVALAGVALLVARITKRRPEGGSAPNRWAVVALVWLLFTFLGVMSNIPGFPVTLFPHRFWVYFAIPVAMIAGELLALVASDLDGEPLCAAALGLALGGALVFSGIAELVCFIVERPAGMRVDQLQGGNAALFLASLVLGGAAATARVYRVGRKKDPAPLSPQRPTAAAAVLPIIIAGAVMTSGYATVNLQGFVPWPPGVRFYTTVDVDDEGRIVIGQEHLEGYLLLRRTFPRGSAVLSVNGVDDHVIGFDMQALPYDADVMSLRGKLHGTKPADVGEPMLREFVDLARRKGLHYLLVDSYHAAEHQHFAARDKVALADALFNIGRTENRIAEILAGAAPTAEEKPAVEALLPEIKDRDDRERRELDLAKRLRELMKASPDLRQPPAIDTGPCGVLAYEIRPR